MFVALDVDFLKVLVLPPVPPNAFNKWLRENTLAVHVPQCLHAGRVVQSTWAADGVF